MRKPVFLLSCLLFAVLIFGRNPSVILDAQFWGEDGWFWYPEAHEYGWHSLFMPHTGYLQTDDRLIALLGTCLPLAWNPLLFAASAFCFQWLVPVFVASSRSETCCPDWKLRVLIACGIAVVPNSWEVYVNLTNSQWHLSVLAILILLSRSPRTRPELIFDLIFLLLSGVSGPFCLFAWPIAAGCAVISRSPHHVIRLAIVTLCVCLQGTAIYLSGERTHLVSTLGASPDMFARLIGGQLLLAPVIGRHLLPALYHMPLWRSGLLPWTTVLVGAWLHITAFRRFRGLRPILVFALLVLAAGLTHPAAGGPLPIWQTFLKPDTGMRYFYIPLLAWITCLIVLSVATQGAAQYVAAAILCCTALCGIPRDYRYEAEPDRNFYILAHTFDHAAPGTTMTFPIRPGTSVRLTK